MTLRVRCFESGDEEEITRLWHEVMAPRVEGSDSFRIDRTWWDWRVKGHPLGFPRISVAVQDDKRVVAHQMMEPLELVIPGGVRKGYLSSTTMALPQGRGLPMLRMLHDCGAAAVRDGAVGIGLPNEESLEIFKSLGWEHIGDIPILVRPLFLPFRCFDLVRPPPDLRLESVSRFDDLVEDYFTRGTAHAKCMVRRTAALLNWRYVDNPLAAYERRLLLKGDDILGLSVCRFARVCRVPMGLIMELFADDAVGLDVLLSEIIRSFRATPALAVSALMINGSAPYRALRRRGFFRVPRLLLPKRNAFIVINRGGDEDLAQLKNWYLSYGDWDSF